MNRLSVVLITRNEAANIARALESVRWADEVIVVDACSEDDTVEICRRYTDKVYVQPWLGFADQRNFGIDRATGDWILSLDADEVVPEALRREMEEVVAEDGRGCDGFLMPRRHWFVGGWLRYGGQFPNHALLLFRRGKGRFGPCRVHETVQVSGQVGNLEEATDHYSSPSLASRFPRMDRCSRLGAEEIISRWPSYRPSLVHLVFRFLRHFVLLFAQYRGYRDGARGFLWAVLQSFEVLMTHARVWEHYANPPSS